LKTHLEPTGFTSNCFTSLPLTGVKVFCNRIEVLFSLMARFQWSQCGLAIASVYVNGSPCMLDDDANNAFTEALTGHIALRGVVNGVGL
jgi:hypothetical protein